MSSARLHLCEITTYAFIWMAGVFYGIYKLHLALNPLGTTSAKYFEAGWPIVNRQKDNSDLQWAAYLEFLTKVAPWLVSQLIVSQLIRRFYLQFLPYWYVIISLSFTHMNFGVVALAMILLQPCIFWIILQLKSRIAIWAVCVALMQQGQLQSFLRQTELEPVRQIVLFICISWTRLRCTSFCLDTLSETKSRAKNENEFVNFLSYIFYLPNMFLGPIVLYSTFKAGLSKPYVRWTRWQLATFLFNIARLIGWIVFTEFALHYVYTNGLLLRPWMAAGLSRWELFGVSTSMPLFFLMKYLVSYGIASTFANAEQIDSPDQPTCVLRVHLYTDMWKNFDRGLYKFLVKYIYVPCLGGNRDFSRRLAVSLLCFSFIFIWHGMRPVIFLWCTLNFLAVTVEAIAKMVESADRYKELQKKFSPQNMRRFHALIASPLCLMSWISCFYFIGGMEIGTTILYGFQDFSVIFWAIVILYCFCQTAIEVKYWEAQRSVCRRPTGDIVDTTNIG